MPSWLVVYQVWIASLVQSIWIKWNSSPTPCMDLRKSSLASGVVTKVARDGSVLFRSAVVCLALGIFLNCSGIGKQSSLGGSSTVNLAAVIDQKKSLITSLDGTQGTRK